MTKKKKQNNDKKQVEVDLDARPHSPANGDAAVQTGENDSAESPILDGMQTLAAERDDLKDKLLRAQAECANITKRLHQQHTEALKYGAIDLARSMLGVLDSLERTIDAIDTSPKDDVLGQGVVLIADQLRETFRGQGVEPIESVGRPFDPMLHEAMLQDRESDLPPGTVTRELQRGYKLHDRVLRPAKVAVASEATKNEGQEDPSQTQDNDPTPEAADRVGH